MSLLYLFLNNKISGFIFFIFLGVIFTIYINIKKRNIKKDYNLKKKSILNIKEAEKESLYYFSKIQQFDMYRYIFYFLLLISFLLYFNVQAFSFFAIALGAIIIALKNQILSIIAHFVLLTRYNIGDDIRINGFLGEIINIKLLYTSLVGRDENGEYNGILCSVPNFLFFEHLSESQELKSDDYKLIKISFLWQKEKFDKSFRDWIIDFKQFLNNLLPQRILKKVGNYKSFAGVAYKIDYEYDEDGIVVVKISFISEDFPNSVKNKEDIIDYIENSKKV